MRLPPEHFTGKIVMKDKLVPVTLPDTNGQPVDRSPGTVDDPVHYLAYSEASAIGRVVEHMIATTPSRCISNAFSSRTWRRCSRQ